MPKSPSLLLRWARLLAPLLVTFVAACGPTPPPKPPVRELPAPASALLSLAPAAYGQITPVALPEDLGSPQAQGMFAQLAGPAATHEPALDLVAAVVGKTFAQEQELPARALLQWLYWKCGAVSMPGPVNVLVGTQADGPVFLEHLRRLASIVPALGEPVSYGVARVAVNGYVAQAIAIGYRKVDIAPTPKAQAPGQSVPVRIAVKKPFANLTLYVDQGGPAVLSVPMEKLPDGTFQANAPMPAAPGRYFVEVVGVAVPPDGVVEKGYRTSVLWLPFYVGAAEPAAADEFIRHPQKNHPDRAAWAPQIVAAYNDARTRLGRPAFVVEQAATGLIQARADLIASLRDLPPPETAMPQKLAAAGLPARNVFGFVDEIEFVSEYITLRLLRPAARFALFDPNVTTIALGLAPRTMGADRGFFSSVEYVFEVIRVDPPKERERILGVLDATHGSAFVRNEPLAAAAQKIADSVCKGNPMPSDANAVFRGAQGLDPMLRNRLAAPWFGYDLRKEDLADIAKDAAAYTNVGVGVCQGTVDGNPGAEAVLILFAGP